MIENIKVAEMPRKYNIFNLCFSLAECDNTLTLFQKLKLFVAINFHKCVNDT